MPKTMGLREKRVGKEYMHSRISLAVVLALLVAVCTLTTRTSAQSSGADSVSGKPNDYPFVAQAMMKALYPELDPNSRAVYRDSGFWREYPMSIFSLEIHPPEYPNECCAGGVPEHTDGSSPRPVDPPQQVKEAVHDSRFRHPDPVLTGLFIFVANPKRHFDSTIDEHRPEAEYLLEFQVIGPLAQLRTHEFMKGVRAHPEWSESQVAGELKKAGARFGPDAKDDFLKFVRSLPFRKLQAFLGDLELSSADFVFRRADEDINSRLEWEVMATMHGPTKKKRQYFMTFEPFDGKLLSLDIDQ